MSETIKDSAFNGKTRQEFVLWLRAQRDSGNTVVFECINSQCPNRLANSFCGDILVQRGKQCDERVMHE